MRKRTKAARKRPPRATPMAILAPVERSSLFWLEAEVEEVELLASVMLIASSEKMSPEMLSSWPAAGSCSQPALRARRTVT